MDVKVNMPGEFSVYNALAALAVGKVLGLPDAFFLFLLLQFCLSHS